MIKKLLIIFLCVLLVGSTFRVNICSAEDEPKVWFSEYFNTSDIASVADWESNVAGTVTLCAGKSGNALQISSSGSQTRVKRMFEMPLNEEKFTFELYIKTNTFFDLGFINGVGDMVNVAGTSGSNVVGLYTDIATRLNLLGGGCILKSTEDSWCKLKLYIDTVNQNVAAVTSTGEIETQVAYSLENLRGIAVTLRTNDLDKQLCMDDIRIYRTTADRQVKVKFGSGGSAYGASITGGVYDQNGEFALKCSEPQVDENGATVHMVTRDNGSLYFEFDGDTDISCDGFTPVTVEIEYIDRGYGWFYIRYFKADGAYNSRIVCMTDTGAVKTETITIEDGIFDNVENAFDVAILTYTVTRDGIYSDSIRRFARDPVLITQVSIQKEEYNAPVVITADTGVDGNIFFERQAEFNMTFQNRGAYPIACEVVYSVYRYDKNNQPVLVDTLVLQDLELTSNGTRKEPLSIHTDVYGLYMLQTEVKGAGIYVCKQTDFSCSMKPDATNINMGVSGVTSQNGYTEETIRLVKGAGLGTVRTDFRWYDYEMKENVYVLTENHEQILDAAAKYDMDVLAILYSANPLYDPSSSQIVSEEQFDKFGSYVEHLLNEPKVKAVVSAVEVLNEPDIMKTYNGEYINADYIRKGQLYAKLLKLAYDAAKAAKPSYTVGAFSIAAMTDTAKGPKFLDAALAALDGEQVFDTITMHPYMHLGNDVEPGNAGQATHSPYDWLGYRINYFTSLITGSELYNHVTQTYGTVSGVSTGDIYHYALNSPAMHTEFGYSSAVRRDDGLCTSSEYEQAVRLIRGYNQIKINNFDDRVWLYSFLDKGDKINDREDNFGIVHSTESDVPLSAKYAYLAIAAFNKLTQGATSAENILTDDYRFITQYTCVDGDAYLLWTTKDSPQQIAYDFGSEATYYDLLGNPLSYSEITEDGQYVLTNEPYYVLTRPLSDSEPDRTEPGIYLYKNGLTFANITLADIDITSFDISVVLDEADQEDGFALLCALYDKDTLVGIKTMHSDRAEKNGNTYIFRDLSMAATDAYDKIKVFAFHQEQLRPLCFALESEDD